MPLFKYMACVIVMNTTEYTCDFSTKTVVPSLENLAAANMVKYKLSKEMLPKEMQTFLNDNDFNLVSHENIVTPNRFS